MQGNFRDVIVTMEKTSQTKSMVDDTITNAQ